MAHAPVPSRIRRVQASALVLLVIAGTLNYVDRAALSIANPLIREEPGARFGEGHRSRPANKCAAGEPRGTRPIG
jgi:hypothetical protein